jgi:hypothetical protein
MSAAELFIAPQSTAEWAERVRVLTDQLRGLTSEEFFDENTLRYHPCVQDFSRLLSAVSPVATIEEYVPALSGFLGEHKATKAWLPDAPDMISGMALAEIYFRLKVNQSDERWVDGALVAPFESGSLVAALARLAQHADRLFLAPR